MLLEPHKVRPLERAYARYGRRLLRRAFARVWLGGAEWPPDDGGRPTIAFANHSAWWDPVLALYLSHDLFRRDPYGVMDGAQLRRFPFFRTIGCFGTTSGGSLADARGLAEYATRLLREPPSPGQRPRTLWLFPQGALLPARGALSFESGLARLALAVPEATLVPVALRFAFREEQRPECFVRLGAALRPEERGERVGSVRSLTCRLERRLSYELEALDADLAAAAGAAGATLDGYRIALDGRGSLHAFYERTLGRLGLGSRS
ncbi:MAG TPA: lysophospholipid acyltransferase family protein [Gemmatimonadaceae bacterium]|nr:lysophospholipid acyltransferase family protein [Gemmatimonadaceae bacterium]